MWFHVSGESLCTLSFLNSTQDQEKALMVSNCMIFPDITFTCSGEVVKWIMGGDWNGDEYPELQIWRLSGDSTYVKLNSTVISVASREKYDVYEYTADPPLPFQPGDILGVLQPDNEDSIDFK